MSTSRRMRLDPHLTLYTKMISKWTKDLIVKSKMLKCPEENISSTLRDTGYLRYRGVLSGRDAIYTAISEWNPIKLTSSCTARETTHSLWVEECLCQPHI